MRIFKALLALVLSDEKAERVRRNHHDAIEELQRLPIVGAVIIEQVQLADGISTPIAHTFNRRPRFIVPSAPYGASTSGRVDVIKSTTHEPSQYIVLQANGWGATITVDVLVIP